MSLQSKIETKLSEALKAQDKKTYSTLRLIIAAIQDPIIAKKIKDKNVLPDNDLTSLLKKMVKQRNERGIGSPKVIRTISSSNL